MWTRSAFTQFAHVMPRAIRVVAFIDLEDIHGLNHRLGYTEVDQRIKAMFSLPFRRSDLVARWYSGDEIVILFDTDWEGAERKIGDLHASAKAQGLAFRHRLGQWEVGKETIEEVVGRLADELVTSEGGTDR